METGEHRCSPLSGLDYQHTHAPFDAVETRTALARSGHGGGDGMLEMLVEWEVTTLD